MKTLNLYMGLIIAAASLMLTACDDWLTLYPQNKLTYEQFWEDKNDLEAVRYAAYRNFASGDVVKKILLWGELRSDNLVFTEYTNADEYSSMQRVVEGRLDTANSYNDWATFYTTINYCNQVLANGDRVQAEDPQFTATEWSRIKAEMICMRALNYFYLVRAFGDVPYVNTVIKTDAEVRRHTQARQSNILDSLINDVDKIKDNLRLFFQSSTETRSMFTQPTAYCLLADLCLWRGAKYEGQGNKVKADELYYRAYQYAKSSHEMMDGDNGQYGKLNGGSDKRNNKWMGRYLLQQTFYENSSSTNPTMNVFQNNFRGAATESLFEMPFNKTDVVYNDVVNGLFGVVTPSNKHLFKSNRKGLIYCTKTANNDRIYDMRFWYTTAYTSEDLFMKSLSSSSTTGGVYENPIPDGAMMKYQNLESYSYTKGEGNQADKMYLSFKETNESNFIIYRKPDALLMEAEAIALLKIIGGAHAASVEMEDAAWIVSEMRRRSYYQYQDEPTTWDAGDYIDATEFATPEKALRAILDEKQLEFVGEGKRWFDIVRFMERIEKDPNSSEKNAWINTLYSAENAALAKGAILKQENHINRYPSALRGRWAFYNPVYEDERRASGWVLTQNRYWDDDPTNDFDDEVDPEDIDGKTEPETDSEVEPETTPSTDEEDNNEPNSGSDESNDDSQE